MEYLASTWPEILSPPSPSSPSRPGPTCLLATCLLATCLLATCLLARRIYYSLYVYISEKCLYFRKIFSLRGLKFRKSGNPENPPTAGFSNGFGHNSDAIRQFYFPLASLIFNFRGESSYDSP